MAEPGLLKSLDEWREEHPEKTKSIDKIIQRTAEIDKLTKRSSNPKRLTWGSTNGNIMDKFIY